MFSIAQHAIPVTTGFTWTAAGAWGSFFALLALVVRQWAPLQKIRADANAGLVETLNRRVDKLEADLKDQRDAYDRKLETERNLHEAERRADRHRMNNMDQCFNALFMMFERSPDDAAKTIAMVKEMRARQMEQEGREKQAILVAKATGATSVDFPA